MHPGEHGDDRQDVDGGTLLQQRFLALQITTQARRPLRRRLLPLRLGQRENEPCADKGECDDAQGLDDV